MRGVSRERLEIRLKESEPRTEEKAQRSKRRKTGCQAGGEVDWGCRGIDEGKQRETEGKGG